MSYVESMQALIHERYGLVLAFREISLPGNAEKSAFVRAVRAIDRRISCVRFWMRAHARYYIRCLATEN